MERRIYMSLGIVAAIFLTPAVAGAMHIAEGYLPPIWAAFWFLVLIPFVFLGIRKIKGEVEGNMEKLLFLAFCGAFAFVLSALKLPSLTGSCSHPTGIGFGAVMFGPFIMSVVGVIVLLFQALLLAHGGLTTLGANGVSMAVVGAFVAYGVFHAARKGGLSFNVALFLAAFLGDLSTYVVTATQLAMAWPNPTTGFIGSLTEYLGIFAVTQIPLAISEGIVTVLIFNLIRDNKVLKQFSKLNIAKDGGKTV